MKLEHVFFGLFALLLAFTGMLAVHYRGELQYERRLNDLRKQAPAVPDVPAAQASAQTAGVLESPAAAASNEELQKQLRMAEEEQRILSAKVQSLDGEAGTETAPAGSTGVQTAPLIAKIKAFYPEDGIAELDQGSNRNLETGQVYAVRRGPFLITKKLTIGEIVEATECAAVIDSSSLQPGDTLRPGDEVIRWE